MNPSYTKAYYDNGSIAYEYWHLNGKCHREDGPATIYYYEDGKVVYKYWWLEGHQATEEEVKRYKLIKELACVK